MKKFKHFKKEEKIELASLYNTMSYVEMANYFDKSIGAIIYQVSKMGIRNKNKGSKEVVSSLVNGMNNGLTIVEICKDLGIGKAQAFNALRINKIKTRDYYTSDMVIRHKTVPNAGLRKLYSTYKGNANKKNIQFSISLHDFEKITSSNCFYCKKPPLQKTANRINTSLYMYNGIDKIDPKGGYTVENSNPCCWECNQFKSDYTMDEFIDKMEHVLSTIKERLK